jgi:penicillin G amidase
MSATLSTRSSAYASAFKPLLLLSIGLLATSACVATQSSLLKLQGLTGAVTITRDSNGVPHIRASNSDQDAFFALGYVHAQDRLWQMELNRRVGGGRLAEILGPAAVKQDVFLRTFGFYRAAQASLSALTPATRQILDAYAAGVNRFIEQGNWPLEYTLTGAKPEPWQPADSLVWAKMLAYDLTSSWQNQIENSRWQKAFGRAGVEALRPVYGRYAPTIVQLEDYNGPLNRPDLVATPAKSIARNIVKTSSNASNASNISDQLLNTLQDLREISGSLPGMGFDESKGSNNWVVSGSRTATGKPMLANDPHLGFASPFLWYFADIRGPTFASIGATLPAVPGVVLGRNDFVAWGATNVSPAVADLFLLDLTSKNGVTSYATPTGQVALRQRQELIRVKGEADQTITVRESDYGPLISDVDSIEQIAGDNQAMAVRWVSLEPGDTTLDAFLAANRAKSGAEFREAMRLMVGPSQNFVYADVAGNIGYIAPGKIPLADWDRRFPARASIGQNWSGYVAFEDLPQVVNPKQGFIVTANNKTMPFGAPEISSYTTEVYRAGRITDLVRREPKMTMARMGEIQGDVYSYPARDLVAGLLVIKPQSAIAKTLQETVRNWDLENTLDSRGATAFAFYYRELARMMSDEGQDDAGKAVVKYIGSPWTIKSLLVQNSPFCDDINTKASESCADFQAKALELAAAALEKQLGSDPYNWRWGDIHKAQFNAIIGGAPVVGGLFNREIANAGAIGTVNVAGYNQDTFIQTHGPSLRSLFDLADLNQSQSIYPLGQSGDVFGAHFDDFLQKWRDNQRVPLSTDPKDWGATSVLTLQP